MRNDEEKNNRKKVAVKLKTLTLTMYMCLVFKNPTLDRKMVGRAANCKQTACAVVTRSHSGLNITDFDMLAFVSFDIFSFNLSTSHMQKF